MEYIHAVILGIIQGLTEFLPVSSSGHLIIFQNFFGLSEPNLEFDISVHLGTLAAIIIFFRKEIKMLFVDLIQVYLMKKKSGSREERKASKGAKLALMIIIGSVPTAIIGFSFKPIADKLFSSILITGVALVFTGLFLIGTKFVKKNRDPLSFKSALIIGGIQGLAVIPGISRSGATISAGLYLGVDREIAAAYSFLLSIPAVLGASLIGIKEFDTGLSYQIMIVGALVSFIVGYGALKFLIRVVKKGRLHLFAPYCIIAGVLSIFWGLTI